MRLRHVCSCGAEIEVEFTDRESPTPLNILQSWLDTHRGHAPKEPAPLTKERMQSVSEALELQNPKPKGF